MYWGDQPGGWVWLAMILSMVLFWGLLIATIVVLMRHDSLRRRGDVHTVPHAATPEQQLAARFAHGEIDEAEFLRRLETLRKHTR